MGNSISHRFGALLFVLVLVLDQHTMGPTYCLLE